EPSSAPMWRPTVGWVRDSARAAPDRLFSRTTARKVRHKSQSPVPFIYFRIASEESSSIFVAAGQRHLRDEDRKETAMTALLCLAAALAVLAAAAAFALAPRREVVTEVAIDAPPAAVWAVLADPEGHAGWNPFLVAMRGELVEGARLANT